MRVWDCACCSGSGVSERSVSVLQETLEDIDKDKDGYISEEEYIGEYARVLSLGGGRRSGTGREEWKFA